MKFKNKLGLGTVQFGLSYGISNIRGKTSPAEVQKILNLAIKEGIDTLDSASAYGNAEEVLGHNDLGKFKVISKFLPPPRGEKIGNQLTQSLSKLKLQSFYGYLAHRPEEILKNHEQWEELQDLKAEGKVKKIGYSLNDPKELEQLLDLDFLPDLIQVPYNYIDRRFEAVAIQLKQKDCEIHTRSAFLQGLFFVEPQNLDPFFQEIQPLLRELQNQPLLSGSLLKFVIEKSFIDKVIVGVENTSQLKENIYGIEHSPELPELKEEVSEALLKPAGWPKKNES